MFSENPSKELKRFSGKLNVCSIFRNPSLEGIHWPLYSAKNPIYYIFNAEGEEDMRADKYGRGPMATSCAFWNEFLPRLRMWAGEC